MSIFEQRAKINRPLAFLVALAGAAAWFQPGVAGSDLWWHLASGRDMWTNLSVHSTDPFSYTFEGRAWMNHEWGWDVLYWGVYQIHPQAVAWLNLGVVTAIYSLVYVLCRRTSGSSLAAGATLWLVAASAHWFLDIRPHLFTLLFVSVFLLTRKRSWGPWLWPPLVVAWANLHSGFVFGVGAIGLYVLVRTIEASFRDKRIVVLRREWISVALCILAMMANPYGYHILEYPLAYLNSDSPFRDIVEWQPPEYALNLYEFQGRFWVVVIFVTLGLPLAFRRHPYLAALSAVTFAMAFNSRRFIPLFGVTAAPLAALAIAWVQGHVLRRVKFLDRSEVALGGIAAAGLIAAMLWQDVRIYPKLLERWTESPLYPEAALRYLKTLGPPGRLLNYYNWGGYIMLHAPGMKLFIDGRANTLYSEEIYLDYLALLSGRPGTHARAARYPADVALLPANGTFARALSSGPRAWKTIYTDPVAQILVPPGSPLLKRELPSREEMLSDHPDYLLHLAALTFAKRDLGRAQRHIEKALELNPLLVRGYGQLAMLAAMQKDPDGIERAIATGIREIPRRKTQLKQLEGRAYQRLGDLPRALAAYREAIPNGPFSYPGRMQSLVRRLEKEVAREVWRNRGGQAG
jgi:tetratricopeptide (TPR) repeat protein